jgi:hypothetical protein
MHCRNAKIAGALSLHPLSSLEYFFDFTRFPTQSILPAPGQPRLLSMATSSVWIEPLSASPKGIFWIKLKTLHYRNASAKETKRHKQYVKNIFFLKLQVYNVTERSWLLQSLLYMIPAYKEKIKDSVLFSICYKKPKSLNPIKAHSRQVFIFGS